MYNADLFAANLLSVLESVSQDALGSLLGDELDGLDDTVDNNVLNAGVFTLGVLTNEDDIDIVVRGLVACDRLAGTEVGEEVEGTAEGEVEGDVSLSDGGSEGSLQCDVVAGDAVDCGVGDDRLAVLELRGDIAELPLDGCVGGGEDVLDRLCDFRADTVTFYE